LPAIAAHVWIEDLDNGKVMASGLTSSSGRFNFNSVPPGNYRAMVEYLDAAVKEANALTAAGDRQPAVRGRAFRSVEMRSSLRVITDKPTPLNYVLVPPQNGAPVIIPRFIGLNGELSSVPVPVVAGEKITVYVGGEGVDQIPGNGLVLSSPFMSIDPASLTREEFHRSTPVISFTVTVAANTPPGDYTLKLQSNTGEVAYLVGSLTINPNN
jgi:hypothetical protein